MNADHKILAVILHYGKPDDTLECIQSVFSSNGVRPDVLVVENSDKTAFSNPPKHVRFILSGGNIGFAAGNNIGLNIAINEGYDRALVLNNDLILEPNAIASMSTHMDNCNSIGMVGPVTFHYHGHRTIWAAGGIINKITGRITGNQTIPDGSDPIFDVAYLPGSCIMVRVSALKKIGLFSDRYLFGFEEAEFCLQARKSKYRIVVAKEATAWHKVGLSSNQSPKYIYNAYRGRFLFLKYLYGKIAALPFYLLSLIHI